MRFCLFTLVLLLLAAAQRGAAQELQRIEVTVEGTAREALVSIPAQAKETAAPLVLVFHGHGGTMRHAARSISLHTHWPEAIVVYPQGLNTPGKLTDPGGGRPGWQLAAGGQNDRDLKFFDALLTKLKQDRKVDERRIFATGHSNGGAFTYLLWAERGEVFAATAPSAAVSVRSVPRLKSKPVMHLAGQQDALVKFAWQERMMNAVRKLNGCEDTGKTWAAHSTKYDSATGTPVVTFIHPGGHEFPREAAPFIVKFFKEHTRTAAAAPEAKKAGG